MIEQNRRVRIYMAMQWPVYPFFKLDVAAHFLNLRVNRNWQTCKRILLRIAAPALLEMICSSGKQPLWALQTVHILAVFIF
jgi:uncharacterized membrane protein